MKNTLFTLAAASLLALTACKKQDSLGEDTGGSKAAAGKKLTVGFAQVGAESVWRVA
jgi:hypothetical protein